MPAPSTPSSTFTGLIALLRPRQWIKNAFVLAALVFSGEFMNPEAIASVALAALLFCVGSSSAYIINDWRDIERDRRHPVKRLRRPLAAGTVTLRAAGITLAVLYGILAAGALVLPQVVMVIVLYLLINVAYSLWLKHQPLLDIFCIASGFGLRVYAGALALSVPVSGWMFITTLCLALFLASIKRRQELLRGTETREVLQRYSVPLVERYAQMAGTGALVFYSQYVVVAQPNLILTIPLVLFGLFRYWYVVDVLGQGESPTDALWGDVQMIACCLLWIVTCLWALWPT